MKDYVAFKKILKSTNIVVVMDLGRYWTKLYISGKMRYRGADKSLARPTSQCILFDGENISFDASLVIYI